MAYDLNGYVDVAERIRQLREKHPHAVLRPYNPAEPFKVMEIGGREFIVYTAACYRTPDDPTPAIAVAAEPAVGKTNYTRDSEVMNAETSAWGRAIVACLAADTQRIASLNEVQNRRADQENVTPQDLQEAYEPRGPIPFPKRPSASQARVDEHPASGGSSSSGGEISMTPKQRGLMMKLSTEKGLDTSELKALIVIAVGREVAEISDLSKSDASKVIKHLMEMVG
jgi:hypothetical protein